MHFQFSVVSRQSLNQWKEKKKRLKMTVTGKCTLTLKQYSPIIHQVYEAAE